MVQLFQNMDGNVLCENESAVIIQSVWWNISHRSLNDQQYSNLLFYFLQEHLKLDCFVACGSTAFFVLQG